MEATNLQDPALNYGVVVDCGSSGSRVFVYYWPPHNGNPHTLLDIRQMKDRERKPVVKKIKPGEFWDGHSSLTLSAEDEMRGFGCCG